MIESKTVLNKLRGDYDIIIPSFKQLDVNSLTFFPIIIVYKYPKDYPEKYVARLFNIDKATCNITRYITLADTLEEIRKGMPCQMTTVKRFPQDSPETVEAWL